MILAEFKVLKKNGNISGFRMSGHAEYDEYGMDIVCSAVTSAVQLVSNGITEILNIDCQLKVEENSIDLSLDNDDIDKAQNFLKALQLHLDILSEDYGENIQLVNMEV